MRLLSLPSPALRVGLSRQLGIIWPFLVTVPLLVSIAIASMSMLAAGRGYVEGESLWSKGQKAAIYHLLRYVQTHDVTDYNNCQAALAVPLGDRTARLELEKPNYDPDKARAGFLQGRNHPDDISGMITLFRLFRHEPHIDKVITLWTAGDKYIEAISLIAQGIHREISSKRVDHEKLRVFINTIHKINAELTPLTDEFSRTLGETTRWTQSVLFVAMILLATTLLGGSMHISRRIIRRHEEFESALRSSEERFQLAVSGSNDGIWDWDINSGKTYYSPRLMHLLGYGESELPSNPAAFRSLMHPEDIQATKANLKAHFDRDALYDTEFRLRTKAGEYRWFRSRGQSIRNDAETPVRMAGSISDVTERKHFETQLFAEKERAQVTLQSIGDAVITLDLHGQVQYLNPVAEGMLGHSLARARGREWNTLFQLVDEKSRSNSSNIVDTALTQRRAVQIAGSVVLIREDGSEIAIDQSAAPMLDRQGHVTGVVLVFRDVSRERQFAAKLSYLATHDALTGLLNRHEFEQRLRTALAERVANRERPHSLLYMDLDQFKIVNDTCGHAAGDELMRQVSTLFAKQLRADDTLARLGGDEFGVLLMDCPAQDSIRIAEELRHSLEDFRFAWKGRSFTVGVSIGVVHIIEDDARLEDIMSAADEACYMAKEQGRNRVHIYLRNDATPSRRQIEMQWVEQIRDAIEENRFILYAQRIVPLAKTDAGAQHVELLIRLRDRAGEIVPPMAFIPAAERFHQMPLIDQWVLRTALATLASRHRRGDYSIQTCSINVSGTSIGDDRFLDYVLEQFAECPVPFDIICFEITETAAISNLAKAERFIHELRELGCRFSLDDFGAGMSSFAYLKQLPVNYVKIDGSFIKGIGSDHTNRAFVEAINHIGHVMGKKTIAEFVENDLIIDVLREIGVDYAQGYGVHRPEPLDNLTATRMPVLVMSNGAAVEPQAARRGSLRSK